MRHENVHSLKCLIVQQSEFKVCKLCIIKFFFFSCGLDVVCYCAVHPVEEKYNYLVTMAKNDPESLYRNENCHSKSKID